MEKKQQLVIIVPEELAEIPVKVLRGSARKELVLCVKPGEEAILHNECTCRKYSFVWQRDSYEKIALEDILWIEADRSYSVIHLSNGHSMTVSFNLSVIVKDLPENDFIRIHRSYVINLMHVESLTGNCLKIGNSLLTIGREYRDTFLNRFIFLGIRRSNK